MNSPLWLTTFLTKEASNFMEMVAWEGGSVYREIRMEKRAKRKAKSQMELVLSLMANAMGGLVRE